MKLEDEAKAFFNQHYNCAQSTVAPFAKVLGVDLDLILKIATPFLGGWDMRVKYVVLSAAH